MSEKPNDGASVWADPDDAPELTDSHFKRADWFEGAKRIKRGRPPFAAPKQLVTMRLDQDVLQRLRAMGPGWQTKVNTALRQMVDALPDPPA